MPLTYDKADSTKGKKKQRLMNQLLMTRSWSYILQLLHEFIFLVDNKLSLRYHQHNCGSEEYYSSSCFLLPYGLYNYNTPYAILFMFMSLLMSSNQICMKMNMNIMLLYANLPLKSLTLRLLMSYIYIYGTPILDVSRSHTATQHSR